ncbi:hypothetical protein JKF63_07296 [Porcisia hertigi]|uniref:Uncharacterized protein n=1 Tax=Porcisia hertigi TaxID=2761500 RepID=A0A837AYD1_9TRYP|nr:hypothetical protein JKF63_07296 [Porcisia hertigi]
MSSRQMRRLKALVDRATGLDANASDVEDAVPDTMQVKKSDHHRQHKKKLKKEKMEASGAPALITAISAVPPPPRTDVPADPPVTSSIAPEMPKRGKKNATTTTASTSAPPPEAGTVAADWEEVSEYEEHPSSSGTAKRGGKAALVDEGPAPASEATTTTAAAAEDEKTRKKAEKKRLRRQKQQQQQRERQAEEDALLDAVLARREGEQLDTASSGGVGSPVAEYHPAGASMSGVTALGSAGEVSFLHLVMACDANQLDTRLERIRMFGPEAVEDVGDGRTPHRRADGRVRDTGSVSFFTAHHMSVRFVHSAFATPNRYRWMPYDSLGIFLTTEEMHDEWGDMCRAYLLACSSNAFQRAQALLEACQERLGGVQDLVDCLVRNRVYHIPTILQCVYAMEATGESAFAAELLDVALYQVGVVLRRFALSGTWDSRQLPCHRSANTLIFQVLQRGVHSALKRGCLRTAYERTRCLLSLDPADPCGMLLLLDYTALRAKRWVWLLEMRRLAFAVRATHMQAQCGCPASGSAEAEVREALKAAGLTLRDAALAEDVMRLPNYAFSWALAKHFIEREEARQRSDEVSGGPVRPSKVLRGLTDAQRVSLEATPSAEELLSAAMLRFPEAGVHLVNALGGVDAVCGGEGHTLSSSSQVSVWQQLESQANDRLGSAEDAAVHSRLAELFVARHEELWRLNECVGLLRRVVQRMLSEPVTGISAISGDGTGASGSDMWPPARGGPPRYRDVTRDSVMGASVAPIPADLLEPDAAELATARVAGDEDAHGAAVQHLVEMLQDSLDTFGESEHLRNLLDQVRRDFQDVHGGYARDGYEDGETGEGTPEWEDI